MGSRKIFMARVGTDTTYGGFVSPIFPDGDYYNIPIPEEQEDVSLPTYEDLDPEVRKYVPEKILVDGERKDPRNTNIHRDPEFETNTYGEQKDKRQVYSPLKKFGEGDILLFYSTFSKTDKDEDFRDYSISKVRRRQQGEKEYHIFSFLELKYPLIDSQNFKRFETEIENNIHYIRGDLQKGESFIVKGTENSKKLEETYRIDSGELKGSNYQLKDEIAGLKKENKDKKGVNRLYCQMEEDILEKIGISL